MTKKLSEQMGINWQQFLTSISVAIAVAGFGGAITMYSAQADMSRRIVPLEEQAKRQYESNAKFERELAEIRERRAEDNAAIARELRAISEQLLIIRQNTKTSGKK